MNIKILFLLPLISLNAFADGRITNADIYSAAAIATTKLAAKTANNVCTFDGSGFIGTGVAPGTSGNVLTSNGTVWTSSATTAALSIGALDAQAENANGLALVSNVLSTQSADATHPGVVNNTTQTLSGAKTFSSLVTGQASFAANNGSTLTPAFYTATGSGNTGFFFGGSGATFAYNGGDIFSFVGTQLKSNVAVNLFVGSSANSPAIYLLGENNSGLYRIGANNLGFSISSTKILDIASTGLGVTGALNVSGTTTLNSSLTGVTRAASGVISAAELSGDVTTSGSNVTTLKNTGAGAGSCTNCSVTFDAQGRETAYSSGTAPVTSLTVASANGFAGSFSAGATPALTLSTTVTGILSGNGTAISAASTTGSGNVVLATSPTIATPTIAKIANLTTNGIVYVTNSDGTLNSGPLTGDVTTSAAAATLATVNSNVGSFTNANITVNAKGLITAAANGSGGSGANEIVFLKDVETSGTDGGTFTAGAWRTRVLNTLQNLGSYAWVTSPSSNQWTLTAGSYEVEATAPAYGVYNHKAKLKNITDASDQCLGSSEYASGAGPNGQTRSTINCSFTIAGTKTFEIQHYSSNTNSSSGFGIGYSGAGVTELYTVVKIQKITP